MVTKYSPTSRGNFLSVSHDDVLQADVWIAVAAVGILLGLEEGGAGGAELNLLVSYKVTIFISIYHKVCPQFLVFFYFLAAIMSR